MSLPVKIQFINNSSGAYLLHTTKGKHIVFETLQEINQCIFRNDNIPTVKSIPIKGFDRNNKWRLVPTTKGNSR